MTPANLPCDFSDMQPSRVEPNREYFLRRLAQEEAAAKGATNLRVRDSHLEMARRYRNACEVTAEGAAPA